MIRLRGIELADEVEGYVHDGETYCWPCLPDKPARDESRITEYIGFDRSDGESDSFHHCQICGVLLKGDLTPDGVRYELGQTEEILESLETGETTPDRWQSHRIKAAKLLDYGDWLSVTGRRIVKRFLELTA